MTDIVRQRCRNHAGREAVAQCPECGSFFCRECITEHDDRVLCASCLTAETSGHETARRRGRFIIAPLKFITGFMLIWFFFYLLGSLLLKLPASFHEGTLWQSLWWK